MTEDSLPDGYVWVTATTTSLEMHRPAVHPPEPPAPDGFTLARWQAPPLEAYRAMFRAVGGPWGWSGRLLLADDDLRTIVDDPRIEIWRLMQGTELAGFIELDGRLDREVEIAYFGLRPEFIGRGLGGFTLRWAVRHVWATPGVERFWLHTCDYDHPDALRTYEKAGFRVFDRHTGLEAYPAEHVARLARRQSG